MSRPVLDHVFGYDFFVSYSWEDGGNYAAALAHQLEAEGFQVFLDRDDYASGDDWKKVGVWTLHRTGQLILVGSRRALVSPPVLREIEIFSGTGRRIVPIEFGGSLEVMSDDAPIARYLPAEMIRIKEPVQALTDGPSSDTIATIRRTFNLVRQDKKRMRALAAVAVSLGILAVAATLFGYAANISEQEAVRQKAIADDRFARLSVTNGERLLKDGDVRGALLWFANPLSLRPKDEGIHRLRLASIARPLPRLLQLLPCGRTTRAIQFDSNGSKLVAVGEDSAVRLWDLRNGEPLIPPLHQTHGVYAIAFAPDGKTFATISSKTHNDKSIRNQISEISVGANGTQNKSGPETQSDTSQLPDATDQRPEISLYDAKSGALIASHSLRAGVGPKFWSISSELFVISGGISIPFTPVKNSWTAIWRPGRPPEFISVPDVEFSELSFSVDRKTILGGEYGGNWLLLTNDGKLMSRGNHPTGISGSLSAVAMSPSGQQFATADSNGTVILWDAQSGKPLRNPLENGRAAIKQLAFSPDGRSLATTGGLVNAIRVWDTVTGELLFRYEVPIAATESPSAPADGTCFQQVYNPTRSKAKPSSWM
jgi:WD40 repeat protein